ncbi:MAG: helix-turn-helix domain-containing protein [Myxococcota bacterium]|nr:TetR/AcrR family transcriptional regulator [Myxococcales bacterium]
MPPAATSATTRAGRVRRPRRARRGSPSELGAKGARTEARILAVAETLFAERGYEGTSLREIARRAGLQQPGLYNYFESKQALYAAVLDRALGPMSEAMDRELADPAQPEQTSRLPGLMLSHLVEHPSMAALFQRALQGDPDAVGNRLVLEWLERLFAQGLATLERDREASVEPIDRVDLALRTIAMFNLTTGFVLAQRAFASMVGGDLLEPAVVERQKRLLDAMAVAGRAGTEGLKRNRR